MRRDEPRWICKETRREDAKWIGNDPRGNGGEETRNEKIGNELEMRRWELIGMEMEASGSDEKRKGNDMNMTIKVTLTEEMLGMMPQSKEIAREFIASKAEDAPSTEEEVAAIGAEAVADKMMTVFPRTEKGEPFLWDYQIKGYFKDACGLMSRAPDSKSKALKAWRKVIDGMVFVSPRQIPIIAAGPIGECQRSLRASTPQGDRTCLANSETVPAGSTFSFTVTLLNPALKGVLVEWLDYMLLRGWGQWRNSGKGRATWEEIKA